MGNVGQGLTEFQVLREVHALGHANIAVGLEQHHRHWTTGLHVTDDKLGNNIQTDINVGRGLDNAERNKPDDGDDEGNEERPPAQMRWVTLSDAQPDANHDQSDSTVPPQRDSLKAHH